MRVVDRNCAECSAGLDYRRGGAMSSDEVDVLHAVTASLSLVLLKGQLSYLRSVGFHPAVLCNPGLEASNLRDQEAIPVITVPMNREISVFRDLLALVRIWRSLRKMRPMICNAGTPKAGLLVGLAAWMNRIPCRVYTLRGLRLETSKGLKRKILIVTERIACACAHRVICVSPSLRQRAVELHLVSPQKAVVLAAGSSNGVDLLRFAPTPEKLKRACQIRQTLGVRLDQPVIGFTGRFTRDKGVPELVKAFQSVRNRFPDAVLLLVGSCEPGDPMPPETLADIQSNSNVLTVEFTPIVDLYYLVMDVFVLPTHREGFPNAALEAQASERPVVTTFATGAVDAVQEGVTGLLVPPGNVSALADALVQLLLDSEWARDMGRAGRARVSREYKSEIVWRAMVTLYREMLEEHTPCLRQGTMSGKYIRGLNALCKRALDLVVASLGLVLLSPLLLGIAAMIRLNMGSPIFFRQTRPGYKARPFTLVKFRTMTVGDSIVDPSTDAERLTPLGQFMRKFSLDEIPQLWNVLKGEMSLVGPRPLLMEYLDFYSPEQSRRHDVPPGISGWAQINGRNALNWEQKFQLDVWYVDHWNFWLDLRILLRTAQNVAKGNDVNQPGHATAEKFGARSG